MRNITKSFSNVETVANIVRVVGNAPHAETYTIEGRKNKNSVFAILAKQLKTTNFFVVDVEVRESDSGEKTYTMDADTFYVLSSTCIEGQSYGHDTIVVSMKVTSVEYITLDNLQQANYITYLGQTNENKLVRWLRDVLGREDVIITSTAKYTDKRWLSKSEFVNNAIER